VTPQVIALLTGHAARSFKPAKIEDELRGKLLRAFAERRLVTVSVPGHAMAGVAYDKESDRIQIWNPWGSNTMYKEFGVKMTHGMMWVPLPALIERSSQIVFEQNADAAPNAAVGHPHKRNRLNRG